MKINIMPDKIASAASYCVSGTLVCGGSVSQWINDLDWNKIAVISGILVGIATLLVNAWFKSQTLKAYKESIEKGIITAPPEGD